MMDHRDVFLGDMRSFLDVLFADEADGWIVLPGDRFKPYGYNSAEGHFKASGDGRDRLAAHVSRERTERTVRICVAVWDAATDMSGRHPARVSSLWVRDAEGVREPPTVPGAPPTHVVGSPGGEMAYGWVLDAPLSVVAADQLADRLADEAGSGFEPVHAAGSIILPGAISPVNGFSTFVVVEERSGQRYQADALSAVLGLPPAEPVGGASLEATTGPRREDGPAAALDVHTRLHEVEGLAQQPDILARFAEEVRLAGYAGSSVPVEVLFLTFVSRLLTKPLCVLIRAASGAGKSFSVDVAQRFSPPEAYFMRTAMSNKALAYSDESLVHRILVIGEAKALEGQGFMVYALRELISSGRLAYEYTDVDIGATRLVEREGPTGLILTTTGPIEPELSSRMLTIGISESPEHTLEILLSIAARASGQVVPEPDYELFKLLQLYLAERPRTVVVPFADELARAVHRGQLRYRRDYTQLLTLIQAHALLHQMTREIADDDRVVASMADYAAVHRLMADAMAVNAERAVSSTIRETVAAVGALGTGGTQVTVRHLVEYLGLEESTIRRRVSQAVEAGYLIDRGGGNRPHRLVLGDPLPEDREALPSPEQLDLACRRARTPEGARATMTGDTCVESHDLIPWGISPMRQLPSPSAAAWLFDLGTRGGPWIVVLRDHEVEARERLAEHLVERGQARDVGDAMALLSAITADHAGVVW